MFPPLLNVSRVAYFIRRDKDRFNYDFDDIDCLIDRLDFRNRRRDICLRIFVFVTNCWKKKSMDAGTNEATIHI